MFSCNQKVKGHEEHPENKLKYKVNFILLKTKLSQYSHSNVVFSFKWLKRMEHRTQICISMDKTACLLYISHFEFWSCRCILYCFFKAARTLLHTYSWVPFSKSGPYYQWVLKHQPKIIQRKKVELLLLATIGNSTYTRGSVADRISMLIDLCRSHQYTIFFSFFWGSKKVSSSIILSQVYQISNV